ncbi:MAG: adenosylcobinamide-phosphate synthase CbiB [Lachnospiraceae bacterium]|nr:adenosylcobinamide-phosphate synthase CbiB [Lachnospiraceae bacterium]
MSDIKYYFLSHIIAFVLGFFLDLIVGDPHWLYHPVRIIGALISLLEKIFLGDKKKETDTKDINKKIVAGLLTVIIVLTLTLIICSLLVVGAYFINIYLGLFIEVIMTYFILATKSLKVESMKVYKALEKSTLEDARKAVSMIVGRDTENLSEEGVVKAAVETVAENTSDGVIAPMIFTCIGGPILGFIYKAVNTMDSMIGYKNDRFLYFGRVAAKFDDIVNFIPARISALLMILASLLGGKNYSFRNAIKIFKRDRFNHASPNSAQTESVCAGALSVRLAGDASYFGKVVKKPYIGDDIRSIERDDIKRICRLMYITAFICMIICTSLMLVAWEIIWLRG